MASALRISPYQIDVADAAIDDLRKRLMNARLPPDHDNRAWSYGTNADGMARLIEYWIERFCWRDAEKRLNRLPQFMARGDGDSSLHFAHLRPSIPARRTIVLTHGWPGSFIELTAVASRLAAPPGDAAQACAPFNVVVPSLPGFGFSSAPTEPGTDLRTIARRWHQLMQSLGYDRYFVHGGDLGAGVSSWLARDYPDAVLGVHLNYIPGSYRPACGAGAPPLTRAEHLWNAERLQWQEDEGAYAHLQRTKPMTLAYGLNDSPAGLAAWIVEKFFGWSDCGGDLFAHIPLDELLTNICLYWFSGNVAATLRLYKENDAARLELGPGERIEAPLAFAHFPKELLVPPREWIERGYNLVRWTSMPRGGHFPGFETPDLLADDIFGAFASL